MLPFSKLRSRVSLGRRSIVASVTLQHYHHGAILEGQKHSNERRRASRGGQNLSARYVRLENSIRGKEAMGRELDAFVETNSPVPTSGETVSKALGKAVEMFRGFVVPEEPKPPADDECCMSGCAVCVYDLHEEALDAYTDALNVLRSSLSALGIPQSEWPPGVQIKGSATISISHGDIPVGTSRKEAILSAFEEMERNLAAKKEPEETSPSVSVITIIPHWRQRQHMAAVKKEEARHVLAELYEGIRWVLFSGR